MIPMRLSEIAEVVGGVLHGADATVTAPAFLDSRRPEPGGLFVAVRGEHTDGHDHVPAAVAGGAAGVLGGRATEGPTVVVPDPVTALGALARHLLDRLAVPVTALTGSQGKTGTKDYLAQVLATVAPTVATAGNYNNELGVPLTVLRADPSTRHLVVEMGARGVGQVARLCAIAPPHIAAVLNVGTAHLGEFGSREAIARAKGEIVQALPPDGTAVLNADDPLTLAMADRTPATVLTFGVGGDVTWRRLELDAAGRPSFELGHARDWQPVALRQVGAHQVANAAAAAAMAVAAGLPLREIATALSAAEPTSRWRMEVSERADGLLVVNDAYNANPDSMLAALDALAAIGERTGRRRVAVLGVMRELGEGHDAGHRAVGRAVADHGIEVLVVVGEEATGIATGAREAADWPGKCALVADRDDALTWVRDNVRAADVVLVKASRGAALEHLAEGLLDDEPKEADPR